MAQTIRQAIIEALKKTNSRDALITLIDGQLLELEAKKKQELIQGQKTTREKLLEIIEELND